MTVTIKEAAQKLSEQLDIPIPEGESSPEFRLAFARTLHIPQLEERLIQLVTNGTVKARATSGIVRQLSDAPTESTLVEIDEAKTALESDNSYVCMFADCSQEAKASEQAGVPKKTPGRRGVSKQEILIASWPIPSNGPKMEKILKKIPKWVEEACQKTGRPGGASHLWNPVVLATCLASRKQWKIPVSKLDAVITKHFSDYEPEWEETKKLWF